MIQVAIIGHELKAQGDGKSFHPTYEFIPQIVKRAESLTGKTIDFCHQQAIDEFKVSDIEGLVTEMLATGPDVLHYANYRDYLTSRMKDPDKRNFDATYIMTAQRHSEHKLPILLTSSDPGAADIAHALQASYLSTFNVDPKRYIAFLKELTGKE
ncbi:hypothetical protein ACFL96_12650 [Thermoproteota archaeon]